jgi:feruloyl-CoA synthase
MLRVAAVAALAPLAQDIVIAGHDEDEVRFLVFPNVAACRGVSGLPETASLADVLAHAKVREAVAQGLAKLKAQNSGSAGHATRALLLIDPPSIDGGEITDKGYINQSAVLVRRTDALAKLRDDASREWIACK